MTPSTTAAPAEALPAGQTDQRVLMLPLTRRDGEVTRELLARAGVRVEVCPGVRELNATMHAGVGALLLGEHALLDRHIGEVHLALQRQPAWSDIPVVLLAHEHEPAPAVRALIEQFSNVTVLDLPASARSVLSAVLAALRARNRQYQMRDELRARQRAEAALRLADRRKNEFLATLAHELRNPLGPISTGLELLAHQPAPSQPASDTRAMMERQLAQLVHLVDDLHDVSRIASGKVMLHRERVDLRVVVAQALEACRAILDDARHTVQVGVPAAPAWVTGDAARLVQVLTNLLTNACKYTPRGGHIDVMLTEEAGEAVLVVADDGAGIPPHLLDSVFDMFTQVPGTLDRAKGGLGIGLSLVRRLVHLHGGSVTAQSAGAESGSTFTLRLPLSTEPEHEPDGEPAAAVALGRRALRVLVVDDNRDAADSLAMLLGVAGHDTHTAYGGAEALRAAAEFRPELVLCDVGMPGVDGHEVARRLRADSRNAAVVLVALTGWGTDEDKRRTREAGFDFHLVKPVAVETLEAIVQRL